MPIQSILDNDLYKFTMMNAVLRHYPDAEVEYRFFDRHPRGRYNDAFLRGFTRQLAQLAEMSLQGDEMAYIRDRLAVLSDSDFLAYLQAYRFDPDEVEYHVDGDGNFHLGVRGNWGRAILWEVPLLAAISEEYFIHCDPNWNMDGQASISAVKSDALGGAGCLYADFGTRRRRNDQSQEIFLRQAIGKPGFMGTSNVHFARVFDLMAIGTMAHEWIMGVSGLEGLRHANRDALWRWIETYDGKLGIALTDTFGLDAFLEDFDLSLARIFDGVRHDSGDPFAFGDRMIQHYESMGIQPETRTLVFSDGLDVARAMEINEYFANRIKVNFGIGTHLTNDFSGSNPLQVVMKMWSVDHMPVIKLPDDPGKVHGDPEAVRIGRLTFPRDSRDGQGG
ncbi:MAG: nicotinate phosphoribosyltransferase [Myxococcota bacterium]|nr:nicotinate phosphoribosyltransferase [Myxococcota bacterium]